MKTRKPTRLSSWQSHLKTQGQSQKCNSETRWRHTAATLLVVTFGTYRRRRRDVIMGRHGYIPLRRFSDVPLRVVGCFIWDLSETSWRRTDRTRLLRPFKTSSQRSNKTSYRRTTETSCRRSTKTSLGVSFGTYLPRY